MYSTRVTLTVIGGIVPSSITVRAWDVSEFLGQHGHSVAAVNDIAHATVSTNVPSQPANPLSRDLTVAMNVPPLPAPWVSRALSAHPLDNSTPVTWFRSGLLTELPSEAFEILILDPQLISAAQLSAGLPKPPFPILQKVVDLGPISVTVFTTVTSLSAALNANGTIGLTAQGTTRPGRNAPLVDFTLTGEVGIEPANDIVNPNLILSAGLNPRTANISFSSRSSLTSDIVAAVLEMLSNWIKEKVAPQISQTVQNGVNSSVLHAAAEAANGGQTTPATLPPGVVLSISQISIRAGEEAPGILAHAALGAFGGVLSKFPQFQQQPSGGKSPICPLSMMAAIPGVQLDLLALRRFRDTVLTAWPAAVEAYYRAGAAAWQVLERDSQLRERAANLLIEAMPDIEQGRLSPALVLRGRRILLELRRKIDQAALAEVDELLAVRL